MYSKEAICTEDSIMIIPEVSLTIGSLSRRSSVRSWVYGGGSVRLSGQ